MKTKLLSTFLLLLSLHFTNAQDIGFLGDFGNWGEDVNMSTPDNVVYTKTNYYFRATGLKFRQDDAWTNSWGGDNFPSGTFTANNIPVTAGFYDIVFNYPGGDYNFTSVAPTDQNISIIGTFNSWTDLVLSTTDNLNYTATNVNLTVGDVKFRRDGNWAVSYGDGGTGLTGTSSPVTPDIAIATDANYDIAINIETLEYSISESALGVDDNSFSKIKIVALNKSIALFNLPPNTNYRLFSLTGQSVLDGKIENTTYVIEAKILAIGVYIIQLEDAKSNAVIRKKIVL